MGSTYRAFTATADAALDAAAAMGLEELEVTYDVPADVATLGEYILAVLDEADDYCRQGRYLLTLVTSPDRMAYQHWIVGEFIRQPRGEPPTAWVDFRE